MADTEVMTEIVQPGFINREMLKLVEVASNPNLVDLGKKLLDACRDGETEEVKQLMQNGAPFTTDWLGTSPLHFAAQNGHVETTDVLLKAGVSKDTRTKVDRTPLHSAAQEGHLAIVQLLLKSGADIDSRDLLKMTPLHWAVERGHHDVVECLLINGADVTSLSRFDKSPKDVCLDMGRLDILPLLTDYYENNSKAKPEKSSPIQSKPKPQTVLPNKGNRLNNKVIKPTGKFVLPPGMCNSSKNVEVLRKLINNGSYDQSLIAALANLLPANQTAMTDDDAAVRWLEQNALNGSEQENDNMFQSALDSGHNVHITEAGKLVLNSIKQEKLEPEILIQAKPQQQKIIQLVVDGKKITHVVRGSNGQSNSSSESHLVNRNVIKVTKPVTISSIPNKVQVTRVVQSSPSSSSSSLSSLSSSKDTDGDTFDSLKKKYVNCVNELDTCKRKLDEKDRRIDLLERQLRELRSKQQT
ncbi:GA-binding protein subunit beta-2 [Halotydeus destructor]|nr:GA-binding protein subunit beta-2 [Halotydeus destructor]